MLFKKLARKIRNRARRRGLELRIAPHKDIQFFGTEYGGFSLITTDMSNKSIVYSFGIGEDISFDVEVIKTFGCKIIGFDPTPKSLKWLETQILPEGYSYQAVGLADYDGTMTFALPYNQEYVSISSVLDEYKGTERIELPVKKLSTLMKENGHSQIDVLKMDIEGSEYPVIKDILRDEIEVNQILIEFHHRFEGIGVEKTNAAIEELERAGYDLFAVADNGEEMSFIKRK